MSDGLNKFNLTLPDDWVDQSTYFFQGPEDGGVYHNLTMLIDHHPESKDLRTYAAPRMEQTVNGMGGAEILKEEEKQHSCGGQALHVVYKSVPEDSKPLFRKQVFLMAEDKAYTFQADFTKKTMKTIALQVDQIIDSFTPLGGG
ncbi:MAG: DUF1795 domain-containing protein [candidate division Zixibacteria bacterium]|nr:DUF1795 domain-containing protein [candidate division Zixibacteria bacterium]